MKNLNPVIVILAILGIGGFIYMNSKNTKQPAMEQKPAAASIQQGRNIFTSIKDALSKSISLKCDYPDLNDPNGKGNITTYIKNGAVRTSNIGLDSQGNGNVIILKDNKMWVWSEGKSEPKSEGMVFTLNTVTTDNVVGRLPKDDQREKVLAEMEKYKNYCKTEVVADSLFFPPADVKFTEQNIMKRPPYLTGMPPIPSITIPAQGE